MFENNITINDSGYFLNHLTYLGVPNIEYNWFWESWSLPPGPRFIRMRGFGFPNNHGIEKSLVQSAAE